jgi:hypothetical protein
VSVASGTTTVTVTFAANTAAADKIYTVSIASTSTVIKGGATVAITQAAYDDPNDTRTALAAGTSAAVLYTATTANVTFTGATGLILTPADFAVTTGGTITTVVIVGGTATVTVTFTANTADTPKTYTVSIATDSMVIKGKAKVTITQAGKPSGGGSVSWTPVTTSTFGATDINNVAYGGSRYIAVGDEGKMARSTNGTSWTAILPGTGAGTSTFDTSIINDIVYGGGTYVAVGEAGKMAWSTDGASWTAIPAGAGAGTSTFESTYNIYCIAYGEGGGGGIFVAGGDKGRLAWSTDGKSWTAIPAGDALISGESGFINKYPVSHITCGPAGFVAHSSSNLSFSSDGKIWQKEAGFYLRMFSTLRSGNGKYVAVDYTSYGGSGASTLYTATNFTNWTSGSSITGLVSDIAYGNGAFVVVGQNALDMSAWYSTDNCATWTKTGSTGFSDDYFSISNIRGVIYGGRFVIVGTKGKIAYSN